MNFALSKSSDQDFRIFMRKVKEKIVKEKELDRIEEEKRKNSMENKEEEVVDDLFVDEKKEPVFLPMNFNLLLDYFINKGKERKSQKKIRRAIKMMRNILTPGRYPDDDPDFIDEEEDGDDDKSKDESEKKEKKEEDEYDRQLREINTMEIMEEFDKLFKMSYVSPSSSLMEQPKPKVVQSKVDATPINNPKKTFFRKKTMMPSKNDKKSQFGPESKFSQKFSKKNVKSDFLFNDGENHKRKSSKNVTNNKTIDERKEKNQMEDEFKDLSEINRSGNKRRANKRTKTYKFDVDINKLKNNLIERNRIQKEKEKEKEENEKKLKNKKCMFFTDMIKKELEEPNVEDINWYYFNKYHSVSLAKKATERKVLEYLKQKEKKKVRIKTSPIMKNNGMILPLIDKNKDKLKTKKSVLKKPQSMFKVANKQLLESFGFRRKANKSRFLY
jgi:hypothetical protein